MNTVVRAPVGAGDSAGIHERLQRALDMQRAAHQAQPYPSLEQRREDLECLKRLIRDNRDAIADAICRDYGNRSRHETLFTEILISLESIGHAQKNLKRWMKPRRRSIDVMVYPGARNRVIPQPLGVVGVIVPWNFPVQLAFSPLASIFAAGNRAMVKLSENSMNLADLLIDLCPQYLPPEKLQFFAETGGVGIEFSKLRFDHLLFTGSGETGRKVMASAAENLVPVTLELGGKSPAVVAPDYPLDKAVERIMYAKMLNAGQACVSVDYCFVPEDRVDAFVDGCRDYVQQHYPDIRSDDFTSIIDERSYKRLQDTLDDAADRGAKLVDLSVNRQSDPALRKLSPHVVLNADDNMQVMQREIFGPILPVLPYADPRQVVDYIAARDRPLAFYPFTNDRQLQDWYLQRVMSGGVTVNDALLHVAQHDLPFGGVGHSGMGHYHGKEGFETFSKLRPVFHQARFSALKLLAPPYGKRFERIVGLLFRLRT